LYQGQRGDGTLAFVIPRDVVWRVVRVDQTSSGKQAWRVVGLSEIVRDQSALFLEA
jgi:hypothetical protein